ncbi:MAG: MFS transporter [Parvularculaceae bacterium]
MDAAAPTRLPQTVWALGLVSLFMDVSSEMIHGLMPLFLTGLGASALLIGVIDGVGEATASIVKIFSGRISDLIGRRKPLLLLGYGLGALSKPVFALAGAASVVFAAHVADRFGKGVRGAPRDALVADVTPKEHRGRAYGLRQALDTAGAFIGPLVAIALMTAFHDDMRAVFWCAAIPALMCVLTIVFAVRETPSAALAAPEVASGWPFAVRLGRPFWSVAALGVVFTLARFSEAFLVLKVHSVGLPLALAPMVLVVMNLVYAAAAYPSGALSDRQPPGRLLAAGLGALFVADIILASARTVHVALLGVAFWGAHLALTQGLFAKMIADAAPEGLRATAFGAFHFLSGLAVLAASVLAGLLWDRIGPGATFLAGAGFAVAAAAGLVLNKGGWPAGA